MAIPGAYPPGRSAAGWSAAHDSPPHTSPAQQLSVNLSRKVWIDRRRGTCGTVECEGRLGNAWAVCMRPSCVRGVGAVKLPKEKIQGPHPDRASRLATRIAGGLASATPTASPSEPCPETRAGVLRCDSMDSPHAGASLRSAAPHSGPILRTTATRLGPVNRLARTAIRCDASLAPLSRCAAVAAGPPPN